jgi:hypothetical protein
MAYGAYLAAFDVDRDGDIKFIGTDRLPQIRTGGLKARWTQTFKRERYEWNG